MTSEANAPAAPFERHKRQILEQAARRRRGLSPPKLGMAQSTEDGAFVYGLAEENASHADAALKELHYRTTLGTCSGAFTSQIVGEIVQLASLGGDNPRSFRRRVDATVAAIASAEPRTELEAQLALQMAATHRLAIDFMTRANRASAFEAVEFFTNRADRLMRTYAKQMETLAKIRRGGEQKVTVEHVHVHEGGQAIVGAVTKAPGA